VARAAPLSLGPTICAIIDARPEVAKTELEIVPSVAVLHGGCEKRAPRKAGHELNQ